jgi:hypothetical protein
MKVTRSFAMGMAGGVRAVHQLAPTLINHPHMHARLPPLQP